MPAKLLFFMFVVTLAKEMETSSVYDKLLLTKCLKIQFEIDSLFIYLLSVDTLVHPFFVLEEFIS